MTEKDKQLEIYTNLSIWLKIEYENLTNIGQANYIELLQENKINKTYLDYILNRIDTKYSEFIEKLQSVKSELKKEIINQFNT